MFDYTKLFKIFPKRDGRGHVQLTDPEVAGLSNAGGPASVRWCRRWKPTTTLL
jgi:hypothetical protein